MLICTVVDKGAEIPALLPFTLMEYRIYQMSCYIL